MLNKRGYMEKVYIIDAKRTAIGKFLGSLYEANPAEVCSKLIQKGFQLKNADEKSVLNDVESVIIGNDCSIMGYVTITDLIHPYNELNIPPKYQKMITKPVEIQDECMIGMGARIMPGVKLGKHCIVGANAVVTQDFDSYTVIAGVPARVIKRIV